ncbi:alanine racemase [Erysipelothrix rhusiopathiae]|uniref:alanine racemase n=1 Tax=Erysipelothrix rhusiopathiae TaxID=1648 RepID=UPI000F43419A|nr:alanine racemase [Erysipelothrix rhusiopathiae]AYV34809.1 alanine racemase [Erysipelothrix rhusiopathiae]MDE8314193.1 alanine racemase [Erysipelothrix rhusiopathiae]MDE8329538.1 alanine racemase [Erysipelothrix rhusiopathiae]MDE8332879.1 alanine racemase [Erysipelothrix rhusiopathiae]
MIHNCTVFVDEQRILNNTLKLREIIKPETKIIAVIKANGYGCGLVEVAHTCEKMKIDVLAVLNIEQARDLRTHGITTPILLLGATLESNFKYLIEYDLMQVIINHDYALKLNQFGLDHGVKVKTHVKVDTGLHRLGMEDYDEIKSCYALEGLEVCGIYSHFVEAQSYEGDAVAFSMLQLERYKDVIDKLRQDGIDPKMTHIQNSPSILNFGDLGFDAVRCGMIMFGLYHPSQLEMSLNDGYEPVLSFESRVCMVRELKKGEFVGYGRTFQAEHDMMLATVSAGYCDGVMKSLSLNGGHVVINDTLCPIVGDIAMSQFMVDVTGVACNLEDRVILFGHEKQTIYDYIGITGQSINELISHILYDIPRIYIHQIESK